MGKRLQSHWVKCPKCGKRVKEYSDGRFSVHYVEVGVSCRPHGVHWTALPVLAADVSIVKIILLAGIARRNPPPVTHNRWAFAFIAKESYVRRYALIVVFATVITFLLPKRVTSLRNATKANRWADNLPKVS